MICCVKVTTTRTVFGFHDYVTTVDNTVMVFTPDANGRPLSPFLSLTPSCARCRPQPEPREELPIPGECKHRARAAVWGAALWGTGGEKEPSALHRGSGWRASQAPGYPTIQGGRADIRQTEKTSEMEKNRFGIYNLTSLSGTYHRGTSDKCTKCFIRRRKGKN